MSLIKSKKTKKSSVSKSKQSLITAGLAVVFVDQVLAAVGANSDISERSSDTLSSEKQLSTTEARPESASSENNLVQSNDNSEADLTIDVAQSGQAALPAETAEIYALNETEEIGSVVVDGSVQNLPPQGNELLLAQPEVAATGTAEASAGVVEASATAVDLGIISPFAIFGAIAAVGLTAGSSASAPTVAPTEAPTTAPTDAPTTTPTTAPTTAPVTKIPESLVGIAALEINPVHGSSGNSFSIEGGVGAIGNATLESLGLSFAQDLNVTLDLQGIDASSDSAPADGTIQLNTSFAGLAGLGIDHITGDANQNVTIANGVGAIGNATLESLGLSFADNLNVTLDLQSGDSATDGVSDGTIQLNTSFAGLADLGIDHITGDAGQDVFIAGGIGGFDSASVNLSMLASSGFSFDSSLDVTVSVSPADLAGYSIGSGGWIGVTTDLAAIGVDSISVGTADVSLADISALISSGLDFAATDNISLVDTDVEGTLMAGSGITLNDLADLGIDTIDADVSASNTFTIVAGGGVVENMSSADLEKALSDILAKFDGVVFADQDNVSLDIGSNAAAVAGLGQSLLSGIELLGIDAFSNGDVELWNKNTAI